VDKEKLLMINMSASSSSIL